jgi:hypothetical protein
MRLVYPYHPFQCKTGKAVRSTQMDLKGILTRRRGSPPKKHTVTAPSPLEEDVRKTIAKVYTFTPLRSRMKRGSVEAVKYPARRQTYMGEGKMYMKQTISINSRPARHEQLLEDGEDETRAFLQELGRKYHSEFVWKAHKVGGVANFPTEKRFEITAPRGADRIYETNTGPKSGLSKVASESLFGSSIAHDSTQRFMKTVASTSELVGPGKYSTSFSSTKLNNDWTVPSPVFSLKDLKKKRKLDPSLLALQSRNRRRGLLLPGLKKMRPKSPWQNLDRGVKIPKAARETLAAMSAKSRKLDEEHREKQLYKLKTGGDVGYGQFVR